MAFTMRIEDDVLKEIDVLASSHQLSRTQLFQIVAKEMVKTGFHPLFSGEGLRAVAPSGGAVVFVQQDGIVVSGIVGELTPDETDVYQPILKLAQDGLWAAAKHYLKRANFIISPIYKE